MVARVLIAVALLCALASIGHAQVGEQHGDNPLLGNGMAERDSLFIVLPFSDQQKVFEQTYLYGELSASTPPNKFLYVKEVPTKSYCADSTLKRALLSARLRMGPKDYEFGTTLFTDTVEVLIQGLASDGTTIVAQFPCTLAINRDIPERLFQKEFTPYYDNIASFKIAIVRFASNHAGSVQSALDANLRLEVFYSEQFVTEAINATSLSIPAIQIVEQTGPNGVVSANPVTFHWNLIPECLHDSFPNYQFQILRLFNRDAAKPADKEDNITEVIDWSRAMTIETGNRKTSLSLAITEGTGFYVWRVRPIGNRYPGGIANDRNWGAWSIAPANGTTVDITTSSKANISSEPWEASIFFYEQFDRDKNWMYKRTFSEGEEGTRIGEVMAYATDLLQPRQTQAHMQSKGQILVNQTVLDYSGRPVISSLAAPVMGNGFGYQNQFMRNSSNTLYTAANFDSDAKASNPDPASNGTLASYYSNANPDLSVPNAEGYAFTQVRYYPDATGRMMEQGGAGSVHRIGSTVSGTDRTSRTYYSKAAEKELIAMFGDEAPDASTVQKIVSIDPNKVGSVRYVSKEGQTLATCLVKYGSSNALLQELDESVVYSDIVEEKLGGKRSTATIMLPESGALDLEYQIDRKTIESECGTYCGECDYTLEIIISSMDDPRTPVMTMQRLLASESCGEGSTIYTFDTTVNNLGPGSFLIERRIIPNNPHPDGGTYLEAHMDGVGEMVEAQSDALLAQVRTYLDNAKLMDLYTYLDGLVLSQSATFGYDAATGDSIYTLTTSCCTLTIPKKKCPETPCSSTPVASFEQLLFDTWGPGAYAFMGDPNRNFGSNLNRYFFTSTGTPLYPNNPSYPGGKGQFDQMIRHMVADGYNCETLWNVWRELVASFNTAATRNGSGNPMSLNPQFNLLDEFLRRVGKKYIGVSNCPYGNCASSGGYGKGYLEYAYLYFQYTNANRSSKCEDLFSVKNQIINAQGAVVLPGPWNQDGANESLDAKEWENFYNCTRGSSTVPEELKEKLPFGCDPPDSEDCILAMKQAAQDTCYTRCAQRYEGFRQSIIDAYHRVGQTVENDPYDVLGRKIDEDGYVLDENGNPTSVQVPLVSMTEVECQAWLLVAECEKGCELTVVRTDGKITKVGTQAELTAFQKAMFYSWRVNIPSGGSCPPGDIVVSAAGSRQAYARRVVRYMNRKLKEFRAAGGDNNPASTIATIMHSYYASYTGSSACPWYQNTSTKTTGPGCCPPTGIPGIFALGSTIKSRFEIEDSCKLIYVRECTVDGMTYVQREVLCNDICLQLCGGDLCFRWEELNAPTIDVVMRPYTCEEALAKNVRGILEHQVQKCIEDRRQQIKSAYELTCADPASVDDELKISYGVALYHFTLYYHDRAGNLVRTVPPKGVNAPLPTSRSTAPAHTYVSSYEYNSLQQLVRQKTPDGGITRFWYDSKGQLRFSQSAAQAAAGAFSYTKYDKLGRLVESGQSLIPNADDLADEVDNPLYPVTNTAYVYQTVFTAPASYSYLGDPNRPQRYLRNRVSVAKSGDGEVQTAYSYDPHGNVEWIAQYIEGLGTNYIRYEYDLISNNVLAVYFNEGLGDQFTQRYSYDEDNRVTKVETSRDGRIWDRDASYHYYAHGPLRRAEYGEDSLQGVDYTYTIHGWLKGINHPSLDAAVDPGRDGNGSSKYAPDAFGMTLGYFAGDFGRSYAGAHSPFNAGGAGYTTRTDNLAGTSLYNGNISSWTSRSLHGPWGTYTNTVGETYRYDRLNRIIESTFKPFTGSSWGSTHDFHTAYSYDPNGNIMKLNRSGFPEGAQARAMDSLVYNYQSGANRLLHVDDYIAANQYVVDIDDQNSNNYGYDASGRLTSDVQEGITGMVWSPYDKVLQVHKSGGQKLRFTYDAMGYRVRKVVESGPGAGTTTYYVRDAEGKVMGIYTRDCIDDVCTPKLAELSIYGNGMDERFATAMPNRNRDMSDQSAITVFGRRLTEKRYELKDHLGNVRVTFSDMKANASTAGAAPFDISQQSYSNYYAFGMMIPNSASITPGNYRYGYNGKSRDTEWGKPDGSRGMYNFEARLYNPAIARMASIDPYSTFYSDCSPYSFVLNMPTRATDPSGELVIFVNGFRMKEFRKAREDYRKGFQPFWTYDRYNYWGHARKGVRMDVMFMKRHDDYNKVYFDASNPGVSTASERFEQGIMAGKILLERIEKGTIKLAKGETIKIAAHSQGCAYAAGIATVLLNPECWSDQRQEIPEIEVMYNLAPKQPEDIRVPVGIQRVVQYSNKWDIIARQKNMRGAHEVVPAPPGNASLPSGGGHTMEKHWYIFDIPEEGLGYVGEKDSNPLDYSRIK